MRTKYHQITLKDTFSDCQEMFQEDTPSFFMLLGGIPLTFPNSSLQIFTLPFIRLSGENASIHWKAFSLPLSYRKSFLSLRIPCSSFSLSSAGNYGISAAFPKSRMHLFFPASKPPLNLTSSRCSIRWSTSRSQSAA